MKTVPQYFDYFPLYVSGRLPAEVILKLIMKSRQVHFGYTVSMLFCKLLITKKYVATYMLMLFSNYAVIANKNKIMWLLISEFGSKIMFCRGYFPFRWVGLHTKVLSVGKTILVFFLSSSPLLKLINHNSCPHSWRWGIRRGLTRELA